jgi:hypothetical protein
MRISVKLLVSVTILLLSFHVATAQTPDVVKNSIIADIKKIIEDYPNHLSAFTGELIVSNPQSSDYTCTLKISGAEECTITKYSATDKTICSWQALMLTTENFSEAVKKFRSLYTQLNGLRVGSSQLNGVYEAPSEEKKFTHVLFSFSPVTDTFQKLKVELVLEAEMLEWKVKLLLYDREREDDERGKLRD